MIANESVINGTVYGKLTIADEKVGGHKGVMAGGTLNIETTSTATIEVNGTVAQTFSSVPTVLGAETQADSAASDVAGLKTDLNALLAKLRTAGVLDTA